jgi:hypothetical protein
LKKKKFYVTIEMKGKITLLPTQNLAAVEKQSKRAK